MIDGKRVYVDEKINALVIRDEPAKPYWGVDHVPVLAAAVDQATPSSGRALLVVARTSPSVQVTNQAVSLRGTSPEAGTPAVSTERSHA
jgi:hypothetical protein